VDLVSLKETKDEVVLYYNLFLTLPTLNAFDAFKYTFPKIGKEVLYIKILIRRSVNF